jgi:hypothetical protein
MFYSNVMITDGENVSFTPSEAQWTTDTGMEFNAMPGLAQKLLDARLAFAAAWWQPREALPDVRSAAADLMGRAAISRVSYDLHEATLLHATDEAGQEQHVITIQMSAAEKRRLHRLATIGHEVARETLELPQLNAVENGMVLDDFASFIATSDLMSPEQATAIGDYIRDPDAAALREQEEQACAVRESAITAGIISALEADIAG